MYNEKVNKIKQDYESLRMKNDNLQTFFNKKHKYVHSVQNNLNLPNTDIEDQIAQSPQTYPSLKAS